MRQDAAGKASAAVERCSPGSFPAFAARRTKPTTYDGSVAGSRDVEHTVLTLQVAPCDDSGTDFFHRFHGWNVSGARKQTGGSDGFPGSLWR